MSGHTPGPWEVEENGADIFSNDGHYIAEAWYDGSLGAGIVTAANARLIAAAPDLLEACKFLYAEMKAYRWDTEGPPTQTYRSVMRTAEAAIAKAEGNDE